MSAMESSGLPRAAFTLREVAEQLGVSLRTIMREIERKAFPTPMQVGARKLVRVEDFKAYLAGRRSWS